MGRQHEHPGRIARKGGQQHAQDTARMANEASARPKKGASLSAKPAVRCAK